MSRYNLTNFYRFKMMWLYLVSNTSDRMHYLMQHYHYYTNADHLDTMHATLAGNCFDLSDSIAAIANHYVSSNRNCVVVAVAHVTIHPQC